MILSFVVDTIVNIIESKELSSTNLYFLEQFITSKLNLDFKIFNNKYTIENKF